MQYRVELRYFRPSGSETSAFYEVSANSPSAAIQLAKNRANSEPLRKVASWGKCSAGPLNDPPPFVTPRPIQNGERITLPLTGTVEIESADSVILHGREGTKVRVSAAAIKRHLGRPIGPVVTVDYYSLYPNQYCYAAAQPVRTSQHGVDQLVQVKVTRHDGVIVNKEIV